MKLRVKNRLCLPVTGLALGIAGCGFAQQTSDWPGAHLSKTNLLAGETIRGKFAYFFASATTRSGCHVAKVEGERGKNMFVRRDGQLGSAYEDMTQPVFSPEGSALAFGARRAGGWFFVVNEREGPKFDALMPDTFAFSDDGKRHAYLAKRDGRLVAVVDGVVQAAASGDMVPWPQPPVFSADGSSVGYLEASQPRNKMSVVVNGKSGETFDAVDLQSLRFSPDGQRFSYAANDRATGDGWFWVIDNIKGTVFDKLGVDFAFSPNGKRTGYTGRNGPHWYLMVNGESDVELEGIVDHSLAFSPDSRRLAYAVAKLDGRCHVVIDGKPGPLYDNIGASEPPGLSFSSVTSRRGYYLGGLSHGVLFSPDSGRLAYLANKNLTKKMVVLDGNPEGIEMDFMVGGMVFSDDSQRFAYGGRQGSKFFLVADGKKGADYEAIGYFGFSQNGKHIAYSAKKGDKNVIVVDGQERGRYNEVPAGPVFRSDGVLEFLAADDSSLYRFEVRDF